MGTIYTTLPHILIYPREIIYVITWALFTQPQTTSLYILVNSYMRKHGHFLHNPTPHPYNYILVNSFK